MKFDEAVEDLVTGNHGKLDKLKSDLLRTWSHALMDQTWEDELKAKAKAKDKVLEDQRVVCTEPAAAKFKASKFQKQYLKKMSKVVPDFMKERLGKQATEKEEQHVPKNPESSFVWGLLNVNESMETEEEEEEEEQEVNELET